MPPSHRRPATRTEPPHLITHEISGQCCNTFGLSIVVGVMTTVGSMGGPDPATDNLVAQLDALYRAEYAGMAHRGRERGEGCEWLLGGRRSPAQDRIHVTRSRRGTALRLLRPPAARRSVIGARPGRRREPLEAAGRVVRQRIDAAAGVRSPFTSGNSVAEIPRRAGSGPSSARRSRSVHHRRAVSPTVIRHSSRGSRSSIASPCRSA